jgi:hypothetical protein
MVLFDNLGLKSTTSGIFRDAIAVGTVVVRHVDHEEIALAYGPDCPVINAKKISECIDVMNRLYSLSNSEFKEIQKNSKEWASRYLNWTATIEKFENMLQDILLVRRTAIRGDILKNRVISHNDEVKKNRENEQQPIFSCYNINPKFDSICMQRPELNATENRIDEASIIKYNQRLQKKDKKQKESTALQIRQEMIMAVKKPGVNTILLPLRLIRLIFSTISAR